MKRRTIARLVVTIALVAEIASAANAEYPTTPIRRCAADAVPTGAACLDKYEATVWRVPGPAAANAILVRRIQLGTATRADLTARGATQLGVVSDDYEPCADDGEGCAGEIYAVSLPSMVPSSRITWFQAEEACANAGKRLPTSAEWQVGANGTPDPGPDDGTTDCNSGTGTVDSTGARSACVSARGAFDMVGNLEEWVADWVPLSAVCVGWGAFSDDEMCLAGADTSETAPGALLRGGSFVVGQSAGPLRVIDIAPSRASRFIGFRCVR